MLNDSLSILNVGLDLSSDDPGLIEEFVSIFGGRSSQEPSPLPPRNLTAHVSLEESRTGYGSIRILGDDLEDQAGFLAAFSSPTIPIRRSPSNPMLLELGEDPQPIFDFSVAPALFRKVPRWRRILSHLLFLRILRLRSELLFFHAASVAIDGKGALLIGPKGSGKTTLSLSLAAAGHEFLGDEMAAYWPERQVLIPFRRPVGIKPGPRSRRIAEAIPDSASPDEEGILRLDASRLVPLTSERAVPLRLVVFLRGFDEQAAIRRIAPGRDELAMLQPLATTLSGAAASARVFQFIRLLSTTTCCELIGADPDRTAEVLAAAAREEGPC